MFIAETTHATQKVLEPLHVTGTSLDEQVEWWEPFCFRARLGYEKITRVYVLVRDEEEKTMSQRWVLVLSFLLLILMGSCSFPPGSSGPSGSTSSPSSRSLSLPNLCTKVLEYEGTITALEPSPHGEGLSLLVHGKLGKVAQQDQFVAHIDQQRTKIYDHRKPQCRNVSLSALQTGQLIGIHSTGIVVTTYPGQIDAVEVIIVS